MQKHTHFQVLVYILYVKHFTLFIIIVNGQMYEYTQSKTFFIRFFVINIKKSYNKNTSSIKYIINFEY